MVSEPPTNPPSTPGRVVICRFGGNEIPIDISGRVWAAPHRGVMYTIDFDALGVSPGVTEEAKTYLRSKLPKRAPSFIGSVATALRQLGAVVGRERASMVELTIEDWTRLWTRQVGKYFMLLRQLHEDVIAEQAFDEDSAGLAETLAAWNAPVKRRAGADVLAWVPDKGAFINDERRLLKELIRNPPAGINDRELVALAGLSILMDTGCRGVEALAITADGLIYKNNDEFAYLLIPIRKARSGGPALPRPTSMDTVRLVHALEERPDIARLQRQYNRMLVNPNGAFEVTGELSLTQFNNMCESATKDLLSPRTRERLKASPRRTRHDHATRQARDGASAQEIGAALGHKDGTSARVYVDATGADFIEALSKVDGNLNGLLSDLASAYETGRVARAGTEEVRLPESKRNEVVGFCALDADSSCSLPRFYSCYGCVFFKPAGSAEVHRSALTHVLELERRWLEHADLKSWAERTTLFSRLREAIERVIRENGGRNGTGF